VSERDLDLGAVSSLETTSQIHLRVTRSMTVITAIVGQLAKRVVS